jgi:hypothetical protein
VALNYIYMSIKNLLPLLFVTLLISGVFNNSCNAQGFGFDTDSVKAEGPNGGFFADVYNTNGAQFRNDSAGTTEFIWIRTLNQLPDTVWGSAVCDINLCHSATTDSAQFTMNEGDSGVFTLHFYPSTGSGLAYMSIEVYPVNDRSKKAVLHAEVLVYDALNSISEINANRLIVFPNPSMDGHFNISNNFSEDILVETYTLTGKKIKETILPDGEKKIDLSDLEKGIYIIRVKTTRGTYQNRVSRL